jgi:hypothetical protein
MRSLPNSSKKGVQEQAGREIAKEMFKEEDRKSVLLMPTEIIEYLYCPRFTYFLNCLNISQHEEQRYKVLLGRKLHDKKKKINRDYLRKIADPGLVWV